MAKYRVGIIGCGGIARSHAQAYKGIAGQPAEIVVGADVNAENAKSFSEQFGVERMYADYTEMLQEEELDIVNVCTWPRTHRSATVCAAESGVKAIMCEKPMATNLGEADQMIDACHRAGATLAIGHQHRFDPQSTAAKKLLDNGDIGEPVFFWGHCSLDLMNNGSHVVDLMNYFNGDEEVEWVMGQIDRRHKREGYRNHPDMLVEDMAAGTVKYKNGPHAMIEVGEFAPQDYQFHIVGTQGVIEVNAPGGPPVKTLSSEQLGWVVPEMTQRDPRRAEMEELIAAMEEGREHLSSGGKGRNTLEILIGIFESARRRALINFPVTVKDSPLESMVKEGMV